MKKKISFEIELVSDIEDKSIKASLNGWLVDNFRMNKLPEIKVEDVE